MIKNQKPEKITQDNQYVYLNNLNNSKAKDKVVEQYQFYSKHPNFILKPKNNLIPYYITLLLMRLALDSINLKKMKFHKMQTLFQMLLKTML